MNIVKETYRNIPSEVKQFLKRVLLLFIGWKLLYGFLLYPSRIPDRQLTHFTSKSTEQVLTWVYPLKNFRTVEICASSSTEDKLHSCMDDVMIGRHTAVGIADPCNGLELIVLYAGFLLCIPGSVTRMITYSVTGIVMICACNILRCAGIALMNIHHHRLTDIAHHYVFKLVVYGLIFFLWVAYSRNYMKRSHE